jgi:hypothetical protein
MSLSLMRWRRTAQVAGLLLTVVACAFVLREMATVDFGKLVIARPGSTGAILVVGIVIYTLLGFLLATAWWRLVSMLGPGSLRLDVALAIYAVTQSYKYLPSNLFHFVGRHAAAARVGVSHTTLAGAATLEAGFLIVAAGLLIACLGPDVVFGLAARVGTRWQLILAGAAAVLLGLAGLAIVTWALTYRDTLKHSVGRVFSSSVSAMAMYTIFFVVCGGIVGLLFGVIDGDWSHVGLLRLTGYVSLAWAFGFLVPGAPAGIGIRETIFILTLGEMAGRDTAIVVAALYRLTTLGGDMLCAAAGLVAWRFAVPTGRRDARSEGMDSGRTL